MIIADENIDRKIIENLRKIGIEIFSIYETERGKADIDIVKFSRNPPRIILTEDKDFGEMVFQNGIKNISVVFLRYNFSETDEMIKIIKNLFQNSQNELFGKFTTITTQKIRSRII